MVKVDQNKCIGCGTCVAMCPQVFQLNEDTGKAEVASQELRDCDIAETIESCPTSAISQEEEN